MRLSKLVHMRLRVMPPGILTLIMDGKVVISDMLCAFQSSFTAYDSNARIANGVL